jgi:exopolysaccharide/PEP-CTERM locus tyrosine autokinase
MKVVDAPPAGMGNASEAEAAVANGKTKRLAVDIAALRAAGCIAEESQGREFAGQYRAIKRPLIEAAMAGSLHGSRDPRLIMISSALPGDGKTFTSINLALSISRERDVSVLLVDADVQKGDVSAAFGIRQRRGLLDALVDETIDIESLIVRTNLSGFSLLSAGTPTEGATELLSSNRMRDIAASLVARNPRRIVLLDSPPLLITTESRALVRVAGQVVLVIRAGKTPRRAAQDALNLFDQDHPVELVLNDAKHGLTQGYYGYGYYGAEHNGSPR